MLGNLFNRCARAAALFLTLAVLLTPPAQSAEAAPEFNPVRKHPRAQASEPLVQRVIVKLRAPDAERARIQSATSAEESTAANSRVQALVRRLGLGLRQSREISSNLHVLSVEAVGLGESPEETLARLRADVGVEFAEPDVRRYPHAMPNDPLYTGQWYLQKTEVSAINAVDAWDTTTGSAAAVVAILDTGVRFDHPDLGRADQGGRLLPGYDFVSSDPGSPNSFLIANDGDGWDSDASDPGDWIDANDKQNSQFSDCEESPSSWHGTRVAGIVGARTDNAQGVAGITWAPLLLPVRVLGKCGGFDSDIIPAMRWAAGIHVAGVPDNLNPAKVINLSLGSETACSPNYRTVIDELTARGVLVVASAGNETGHAVDSPANCPGVLGVAGLRHAGTKVGYSNIGPEIGISAPAGNCVNLTGACLFSIHTTFNLGATTPGANDYTDQFNTNLGTSFSAPIVAAAAALVFSIDSNLTPAQVINRLKETATAFPTDSTLPTCQDPASVANADQLQCNCTTTTCGAGMLNVAAAVAATTPTPTTPTSSTPTPPTSKSGGGGMLGLELLFLLIVGVGLREKRLGARAQ